MKIHDLKISPNHFRDVCLERKKAEMRRDDRNFEVGDHLLLREYLEEKKSYTGSMLVVLITHILDTETQGIKEGYVMLSIEKAVTTPESGMIIEPKRKLRGSCGCNPMYSGCRHWGSSCPTDGKCFKPSPCPRTNCIHA